MRVFIIGAVLLGLVLGLFWLDDRVQSHVLARFAHGELAKRLVVIALALMAVGALMMVADLLGWQ